MKEFKAKWGPKTWESIIEAIGRDRLLFLRPPPVPTPVQLEALVRTALEASFEREEGRDVLFALVFCPPTSLGKAEVPPRFGSAIPLCSSEIRRLALAVEPNHGIGVDSAGDGLQVWGIPERREGAVEVRAVGPGRVIVRFGGANVAQFVGGQCTVIGCTIYDLLERLRPSEMHSEDFYPLALYLLQLGLRIRSQGHGGTLVVLGSNPDSAEYEPRYDIDPPLRDLSTHFLGSTLAYRRSLERLGDHEDELYLLTEVPELDKLLNGAPAPETERLFAMLSCLAAVDGAIILDSKLNLLCFGATLKSQADSEVQWREWAPGDAMWTDRHEPVDRLGNNRHKSAFHFVRKNPGTIAIVCSHDGGLTMLARPSNEEPPLVARFLERVVA